MFMKSHIHADVVGDTFSNRSQKVGYVKTVKLNLPHYNLYHAGILTNRSTQD